MKILWYVQNLNIALKIIRIVLRTTKNPKKDFKILKSGPFVSFTSLHSDYRACYRGSKHGMVTNGICQG